MRPSPEAEPTNTVYTSDSSSHSGDPWCERSSPMACLSIPGCCVRHPRACEPSRRTSTVRHYSLPRVSSLSSSSNQCRPRNIYIDLGANWCNTLRLHADVPEANAHAHQETNWEVWGFEVLPALLSYVERCAAALSAARSLPTPPVPPAGSTKDLWRYASLFACERYKSSGKRDLGAMRSCMLEKLWHRLEQLPVDLGLGANQSLVASRLSAARQCHTEAQQTGSRNRKNVTTFVMIPAAASIHDGTVSLWGSPHSLIAGGGVSGEGLAPFTAAAADVASWMLRSFSPQDFVILKMDIEGGEKQLLPVLFNTGAAKLVRIFLWECHHTKKSWCESMEREFRAVGAIVYHEPYPFQQPNRDGVRRAYMDAVANRTD
jgi:hypothetical protein